MCLFYSQVVTLSVDPNPEVLHITAETLFSSDPLDPFQHTHAHTHTPTNTSKQSKTAIQNTLTYMPSFISALLNLLMSQLYRRFSYGDMNTKFAQILLPVVWLEQWVLK